MRMNGTISTSFINDSYKVYNNATRVENPLLNQYYKYYIPLTIYRLVMYSVVCLLGTIGNGLVIWFSCRMEKTVNVIWFLNLAIVDFSFALLIPLNITYIALENHWPFGNLMCKFTGFLMFFNMSASVLQLTVISVDRCICVVFPVWCHNHRTRRLALIAVLIIWVISIALNIHSYIFRNTGGKYKIYCLSTGRGIWIQIVKFVFSFLVPFIVIFSCYATILLRLKGKKLNSSKPFKTILATGIAFFLCWFLYYLVDFFRIFKIRINKTVELFGMEIASSLMLFNTCINPILYVFIGRDFKQKFCASFQAIFEKAFIDDTDKINLKEHEQRSPSGIMLTSPDTAVI